MPFVYKFFNVRQIVISYLWSVSTSGQMIDSPRNGAALGAWDIPVSVRERFKDAQVQLEVPHTASIKVIQLLYGSLTHSYLFRYILFFTKNPSAKVKNAQTVI